MPREHKRALAKALLRGGVSPDTMTYLPFAGRRALVWTRSSSAARASTISRTSISSSRDARVIVVTGVSGSGKSSLAFDTIFAEGQRRYIESLSTYARQFIEKLERPDVDDIAGISPTIAIRQKNTVTSARSTVGTATEIYDYLRLLFARVGRTFCPRCDIEVRAYTPSDAAQEIIRLFDGKRINLLVPLGALGAAEWKTKRGYLLSRGYTRLLAGEKRFASMSSRSRGRPRGDRRTPRPRRGGRGESLPHRRGRRARVPRDGGEHRGRRSRRRRGASFHPGAALLLVRDVLRGAEPAPLLVQQPLRRVPRLPRIRRPDGVLGGSHHPGQEGSRSRSARSIRGRASDSPISSTGCSSSAARSASP